MRVIQPFLSLLLLALPGCSDSTSQTAEVERSDLFDTDADIDGEKGSESYADYDARRDSLDEPTGAVGGFECTEDCSGHDAGYAWAEERGVADESECGGHSWSFEEGCVAYVEEQAGEADAE